MTLISLLYGTVVMYHEYHSCLMQRNRTPHLGVEVRAVTFGIFKVLCEKLGRNKGRIYSFIDRTFLKLARSSEIEELGLSINSKKRLKESNTNLTLKMSLNSFCNQVEIVTWIQ